jgi:RimJ/RimL family protein N-acetyltransferase
VSYLETQRLILRTWMPGDVSAWHSIVEKPDVHRYLPIAQTTTPLDVRAWVDRQMEQQERRAFSCWPAIRKDDGSLIGCCGLDCLPGGDVEVIWILDSALWGHGYAREAGEAVLGFARTTLRLPRVVAFVDPGNSRGIGLINRLQMRFDRVARAHHRDLLRYTAGAD